MLILTTIFGQGEQKFHAIYITGVKVTHYFRSWERKYVGTKVPVTGTDYVERF